MYYRRYSGVDSRDAARRGNPRSGKELRSRARRYKRIRGLQLAATAIPTDQFCRGTALDFLFLPLVDTNSRQEAFWTRSSSAANFKQLVQLVESRHKPRIRSLTGAAVIRISMGRATPAGVTLSFSFPVPFSTSVHSTLCVLCLFPLLIRGKLVTSFEPSYL